MNPTRPSDVAALLQRASFQPSRVLGQSFLVDGNILRHLLREAALDPHDRILEVGPGLGVVTGPLLAQAACVRAVEKDPALVRHLRETLGGHAHLDLVEADILDCPLAEWMGEGIGKVVSNLPYAIASRLLVELSFTRPPPARIVVTVQQEVAERLTATPGSKAFSALTVLVGHTYEASICHKVSPTCFLPRPRVYSAIVRLEPTARPRPVDAEVFRALVRGVFSQRRKQLVNSLAPFAPGDAAGRDHVAARLSVLGIDPRQRPEMLAREDFVRLADDFAGATLRT